MNPTSVLYIIAVLTSPLIWMYRTHMLYPCARFFTWVEEEKNYGFSPWFMFPLLVTQLWETLLFHDLSHLSIWDHLYLNRGDVLYKHILFRCTDFLPVSTETPHRFIHTLQLQGFLCRLCPFMCFFCSCCCYAGQLLQNTSKQSY